MIYMHPVACIHPVRKRAEERSVDLLGDSKRLCVICLEEIGFSLVLVLHRYKSYPRTHLL